MRQFTVHTGQAAPLRVDNVDTDQIIPVRFLTRLTKDGHGQDLFADWRGDPAFVLNHAPFDGSTILVAGRDFGTGSSRESAVYALTDWGFRAIIAPRFGDIFTSNAFQNGLLPVIVPEQIVERLWEMLDRDPTTPVTVDLERGEIYAGQIRQDFSVPADIRRRLLEGVDEIGSTLEHLDWIHAHEAGRRSTLPTTRRVH